MSKAIEAWHFLAHGGEFGFVEVGHIYSVEAPIELCKWGFHGSTSACDALSFAISPVVGRVVLSGQVIQGRNKACAMRREYLWIADATEALRAYARWCALQVIGLWDAPDVVRRYLADGEEGIVQHARSAAYAAYAAWDDENIPYDARAAYAARAASEACAVHAVSAARSAASYARSAAAFERTGRAVKAAQSEDLTQRLLRLRP